MSVNRVILVGNVGRDAEVKFTQGGQAMARFSMATSERWAKEGQAQEKTEWHQVLVWGKLAEICGEHVRKGRQVYVEGRLQAREWQDKEGQKRQTTEVVASQVVFLGRRDGADGGAGGGFTGGQSRRSEPSQGADDIPF